MNAIHVENAALRLHTFLETRHSKKGGLVGPDPGIRLNYRFFRFVKSALRALPWFDSLYYLQAQGYWVLANARLWEERQDERYLDILRAAADTMLARQGPEGAWPYPNPEWRGRVATAEGVWGAIGLLEAFRQTGDERYRDGALAWNRFMLEEIGFHENGPQRAIHYFAGGRPERIPNNSAFALRFLAELADALRDSSYLEPARGMVEFLFAAQTPWGEMPYALEGDSGSRSMPHFQCYQYNAFQLLDLMRYHELTGDRTVLTIIERGLPYLETGVHEDGHVAYACEASQHTVTYHTAVVAAAFRAATRLGFDDYTMLSERAYEHVLGLQREDGSFPHSRGDYRVLSDVRAYPRYLAMILYHLLEPVTAVLDAEDEEARAAVPR